MNRVLFVVSTALLSAGVVLVGGQQLVNANPTDPRNQSVGGYTMRYFPEGEFVVERDDRPARGSDPATQFVLKAARSGDTSRRYVLHVTRARGGFPENVLQDSFPDAKLVGHWRGVGVYAYSTGNGTAFVWFPNQATQLTLIYQATDEAGHDELPKILQGIEEG